MTATLHATILTVVTTASSLAAQAVPRPVDERGAPPRPGERAPVEVAPFDPAAYVARPLPTRSVGPEAPRDAGVVVSYDVATGTESVAPPNVQRAFGHLTRIAGGGGTDTLDPERGLASENLGALSLVADATPYPWSMNVKLFVTSPNGWQFAASGVLIDPKHVLTAGHCVHDQNAGGWASNIVVVPAYAGDHPDPRRQRPYGSATGVQLHTWTGWANSQRFEHDIGIIDLDRPVGALTSWFGFGYTGDSTFFTEPTWHHASYPGESPYDGNRMHYQYGSFDHCPNHLEARFDRYSYGGESGSGLYKWIGSSRFVFAILSNGTATQTWCPRLDSGKFNDIGNVMAADRPDDFDLTPLAVTGSPAADRGSYLESLAFKLHNYSKEALSSRVEFAVYLSINDVISEYDRLLGGFYIDANVAAVGTQDVAWSAGLGPRIPANVPTGDYYVGIIVTTPDADSTNQRTLADDVLPIHIYEQGSFSTWGAGCVGTNGREPSIGIFGQPILNQEFSVTAAGTDPYAATVLHLGWRSMNLPLAPFGAPGCTAFVDPSISVHARANSVGTALMPILVRTRAALGFEIQLQWLANDPSANRLGWTASNAATLVIGTR